MDFKILEFVLYNLLYFNRSRFLMREMCLINFYTKTLAAF